MRGKLAKSKAGHDKGSIYVVLGEDADWAYLSDGRLKPVEKPKKKNKKHIQLIGKLPNAVAELLPVDREFRNEEVKRAIKLYIQRGDALPEYRSQERESKCEE